MHAFQTEKTVSGLFFSQAGKYGDDDFMFSKFFNGVAGDRWISISWREAAREVKRIGAGLIELGIGKGDRVAIFANNRPRWVLADQAIQGAGAWGVPIYATSTDEQLAYILNDCGAKAVFVGDEHLLAQARRIKARTPALQYLISMSPTPESPADGVIGFDSLAQRGRESEKALAEFDARRQALTGDDVTAIIYTSGTTGEPKGAVLTHGNFMADVNMMLDTTMTRRMIERGVRMSSLCHLPLCHIYGRTSDYHVQVAFAGQVWFAESYNKVPANLIEVRPQMLITIPRLYEKVYEAVQVQGSRMKGIGRKFFDWAFKVGNEVVDHISTGKKLPPTLALEFALAGSLVFNRIRSLAGLDRVVFAGSGGGALSAATNRFFRAMNIQVGEGYGLTETTSAITWNSIEFLKPPPDNWLYRKSIDWLIDTMVIHQGKGKNPFANPVTGVKLTVASNTVLPLMVQKPGTVGRPCKDTEIKLAEDGEILVRGPQVFHRDQGYYHRPDLTAEVFTPDGFFMTGDIGHFDPDNFLIITDRKKELLVTAGGKNVAPHPIELALTNDPFIEQACVIGDSKKYISALLVPQFELLERWAKEHGLAHSSRAELIAQPEVKKFYAEKVKTVNNDLARYEQLKTYCLLPLAFSEETGELTPTQKVKRRVVYQKFAKEIASCYAEAEKE